MTDVPPPGALRRLLAWALPEDWRHDILRDLDEVYARRRRESGRGHADLWYARQALSFGVRFPASRVPDALAPLRQTEGGRPMRGVTRSTRLSVRRLLRSPGFTLPTILILAVGLGASATIFTVVDGVLLEPLAYPDSDELVVLCENHRSIEGFCIGSVANVHDLGRRTRALESAGTARGWSFSMEDDQGVVGLASGIASPDYFRALRVRPALGRLFADDEMGEEHDDVLLLSHGMWTTRFGADSTVVGRTVRLDGEPVVIIGVLPRGFEAPGLEHIEAWRPVHVDPGDEFRRQWRGFRTLARLAPGASVESARAEATAHYRAMATDHEAIDEEWRLGVRSLKAQVVGGVRPTILAFGGAVILLLLIVCANVANLVLARTMRRRRELAIRAALGAPRGSLVLDRLLEGLVLGLVAGGLAVLLAWWGSRVFVAIAPAGIPRLENIGLDGSVVGFTLLLALFTVGVVGLVPAFRMKPLELGREITSSRGSGPSAGSVRFRRGLVVAELALSLILVFGGVLLARTFGAYLNWDPGFDRENLLVLSAGASTGTYPERPELMEFWARAEEEVSSIPGVAAVATASSVPLRGGRETGTFRFQGSESLTDDQLPSARWYDVGPTYFETMGIPVLEGRDFNASDGPGAPLVALVNETLANTFWPDDEAVGKWIDRPATTEGADPRVRIIGVVRDVRPLTPGQPPEPEIYWSNRQLGRWGTVFVVRTEPGAPPLARLIQERLESLDPTLSVGSVATMEELLARPLSRPRFNLMLAGSFAVVAALLAGLGLYSVLAYTVAQGSRSIGLRMAMGSTRGRVVLGVLAEGGVLALVGVAVGAVAALGLARLASSLVHGVSTTDPASLVLTAVLLVILAVVASGVPALRASRVDPVELLRQE